MLACEFSWLWRQRADVERWQSLNLVQFQSDAPYVRPSPNQSAVSESTQVIPNARLCKALRHAICDLVVRTRHRDARRTSQGAPTIALHPRIPVALPTRESGTRALQDTARRGQRSL